MPHLEPTYLRYIYDGLIKGSIHPENAAELPDGLIGMYEEAFDERTSVVERQKLLQRFAIWALLKKAVSSAFVAEVLGETEDDIQEFISTYSAWFNSPESGKYQLYHERLKVYLLQKLSEGEVHMLYEKLITRLERAIEEQKSDEFEWYGLEFLAGHLGVSGIINEDKRLFKYGRRADFESRQIEISEGFEWSKSLYKNCIKTSSISDKDNVLEWGIKLHLINQAEQKDWGLIQRHFDLGEISRFESELEEKINQFSFVSDNYLSYPTLLIYAFYFRLIENVSIQRLHMEKLFDLLNKSVDKHAIYLFDFPRLHLVIIERFNALGFDVSFLIKKFNFQMCSDDAQKCLFPSDFLLHGIYDNLFGLFKAYEINEGDFLKTFLHLGLKYSTENIDEIIGRIGLLNFDKSILETRIKDDLKPLYLIDILTNAVEKEFDSFLSAEKSNWNEKKLYDIIEFALLNESFFKTIKWEQFALKYLRKSDDFDYRAINLLNLIKKISDSDLINVGLLAIKTNQDSLVSVFFGYLVKHNKIGLIKTIIDKTPNHSTNLTLWNFLLENKFNLEILFESSLIESKELKRIWLVNTIRYFRNEIPTNSFIEYCQYSENASVNIDQEKIKLDCWLPESLLKLDFNNNSGVTYSNHICRLNSENNLEFVALLISNSDVYDQEVQEFLHFRIQELLNRKKTGLNYESVKATFSFLLKHSRRLFDFYFDQLLIYLNSLPTNEKYLNSLSFIYELFEREGFKYEDVRLADYFYSHFIDSKVPRHPDLYGELTKMPLRYQQKRHVYSSYIKCFWFERNEDISMLTLINRNNEILINTSLVELNLLKGNEFADIIYMSIFEYCEFLIGCEKRDDKFLEKIQSLILNLPGGTDEKYQHKELIQTYTQLNIKISCGSSMENFLFDVMSNVLKSYDEPHFFYFQNKSFGKISQKASLIALGSYNSPFFTKNVVGYYENQYFSEEIKQLADNINSILNHSISKTIQLLKKKIKKPKNAFLGIKAIQKLNDSIFHQDRLNNLLKQFIDENISSRLEIIFENIKDSSTKSESEEKDFEKAIEDLAESENIVLLLYCSLLIQISDKKHEKKVELIKKVIQELAKAGYYDFSDDIEEYTEYEGDLIFLTYIIVKAYNPPSKTENKLLIYLPLRIKFIFIFTELLKKEKSISSRTKKSAREFIDYCLSKKLSVSDLTSLYESSMVIDSQIQANKIIKRILLQIEPDEDLLMNTSGILRSCLSFKDSKNIGLLIHSKNDFIQFPMENLIEARIMLRIFEFEDYNNVKSELDIDAKINILSKLVIKSDLITLKSNVLPEIDLHRDECHENDPEIFEDYLVEIGCQLYQRIGLKYSKDYVLERSYSSVSTITYFISELIIKNEIKEVDIFIRKARLKCEINEGELMSKLFQMEMFQLDKMENTILAFYNENSKECLEMMFSTRGNDLQTPLILSKLKYRKNECQILIDNVEKLNFTIEAWINIIKQQPSAFKPVLVAKIISIKKSQITSDELNLLQESIHIVISQKSINEIISSYSDFKQWNRIERILQWLKKQDRLVEIQDYLKLAYDKEWEIRLSVFVRLLGKENFLKIISSKTRFINSQVLDSIYNLSEIPRFDYHVHPHYFELIRGTLDDDLTNSIFTSLKSRTTEAGYCHSDSFSNLYWTRMNATEINRYISIYYNNREALELLVGNFKILSELEGQIEYTELLSQFDVNYAKYDVEL